MTQTDVLAYLPQRPPFVMIDEIVTADETVSRTTFTVREGHLFVQNGFFTEGGLVENMAQTAAAGTGMKAQNNNKPAPVGYIGALKNLVINELPAVGETIITEITFMHQVLNVHVVQGRVFKNSTEIAACELKIFVKPDTN